MNIGNLVSWTVSMGKPPNLIKKTYTGILTKIRKNPLGGNVDILEVLVDGEIIEANSKNVQVINEK